MQTQHQGPSPEKQRSPTFFESLGGCRAPADSYDELLLPNGSLRPHWAGFAKVMNSLGSDEVSRRWEHAQRLIHDHSITYGAVGAPSEEVRPWQLDSLPLVLAQEEWSRLAEGLKQRAVILERTLTDLYGPQRLIKDGILPPEIIFAHPGFFTQLRGLRPSLSRHLHSYAADLGRSRDGTWWLLADRAEAPSGAGYALENRVVTSRMLPEPFRACHVQRLVSYFMSVREACRDMAPSSRENPRIVVLSQGPSNANYFEDAYLSRYLGYTLVQASDLAVRDRKVWLKTLGGLYRVDVIVRRPNTSDCDPLELPTNSASAIAGLTEAARAGNVAITNPLGSGLVESPIFMAFIGLLCKHLLGEDLKLPSVATWWCGDATACKYVLANLDRLVVKHAFRQRGQDLGAAAKFRELSDEKIADLIRANPANYVGQERVVRSSMPIWGAGKAASAYLALRAFLVASGDSYHVMDGGITRTSRKVESLEISLLSGEGSKDAWIQGTEPPPQQSLMSPHNEPVELRRTGSDLPSRVADDIYWLGRHLARVESAARLLRAATTRLTSEAGADGHDELPMLLRCLADQGLIEPGYVVDGIKQRLPAIDVALPASLCDQAAAGSMRSMLARTFATGLRVRDRMSIDSWRILVRMDEHFRLASADATCDLTDLLNMANELIVDLAAFIGMISGSMTRSLVFRFMDLGFRIEVVEQTVSLLSNAFVCNAKIESSVLECLLDVSDCLMTYRYRYLSNLQIAPVLDLMITDDTNPRSIMYQLACIDGHIKSLPRTDETPRVMPEQKQVLSTLYAVQTFDAESVGERCELGDTTPLIELLKLLERAMPPLSQAITNKYMVHAGPVRMLASIDQVRLNQP